MNGYEIHAFMRNDPHTARHYIGTFAADTLPRYAPHPSFLVMNNLPSYTPGEHWLAAVLDEHGHGQYFDSYGRSPVVKEHRDFMNRNCTRWNYNETCLQSYGSDVCGHHCLMYLLHRAHGITLTDYIQSYFSHDVQKNDEIVSVMFQRYTKKNPLCEFLSLSCHKQKCFPRKKIK